MFIKAPAKLNLHLEVTKKRRDGFHNLRTVFQLINLYDELEFKPINKRIELEEKTKKIQDNIVLKAAYALKDKTSSDKGVRISLKKKIPIQRGLGGGSSDAAATLIALNLLWETNLNKEQLLELALNLGSDVPFFIHGQATWAEGRGELFSSINLKPEWYLLVFPKTKISTSEAFMEVSVNSEKFLTAKDFQTGMAFNSFTNWAKNKYPEVRKTFSLLESVGTPRLTGTGSTVFVAFSNKIKAEQALKEFPKGILVKNLDHSPLIQLIE